MIVAAFGRPTRADVPNYELGRAQKRNLCPPSPAGREENNSYRTVTNQHSFRDEAAPLRPTLAIFCLHYLFWTKKIAFETKYLTQHLAFIAFQTLRASRPGDFNEKRGTGTTAEKRPLVVLQ